jgi:uncharacterized protein HemX/uroporphyrinogen-III synthase
MGQTLVVCKPKLPERYAVQRNELLRGLNEIAADGVVYFPVFELSPDLPAIEQIAQWIVEQSARSKRMLVFVSPSVLELAVTTLGAWPEHMLCGVMGNQSKALAVKLGIPEQQILAPSGTDDGQSEDSDGLANLIAQSFDQGSLDVIVCKGPRGRVEFPEKLRSLGHDVRVLECYDRQPIVQTAQDCERLFNTRDKLVFWITSSETVDVLDSQLGRFSTEKRNLLRTSTTVLTTHPRITLKCKELGYAHVEEIATGIQSVHTWLKANQNSMDNKQSSEASTVDVKPTVKSNAATVQANPSEGQWLGKAAFFISVLSFILILLIAFAGKNQIEKTRLAFGERIQKESTTLDLVKEQIGKSSDLTKDLKTRFDLLEAAQKEEASQRASLEEVYNSLLASRTEVSLSEVEQLISIAKRQLFLLGNVNGASIALAQAVELLEKSDKPSLLNLRAAIESDLAQIRALPSDDLVKLAVSLDSVINAVDGFPLLSSVNAKTDQTLADLTADEHSADTAMIAAPEAAAVESSANLAGEPGAFEQSAQQRLSSAWVATKKAMADAWYEIKSLIEVTKVNTPEVLLLSSRQEEDLRNTLRLSMLNARISLLSRQAVLLKSDLQRSEKLLDTYFDPSAYQVQRAKTVFKQIDAVQLDLALPELQATTAALRLAVASQQGDRP